MYNSKINNRLAFTLVELIVAITILAILWTIAFFAFQWYSKNSRDSARVSNISRMKTSLDIFAIEAWKYPIPTNSVDITFSWWTIWKQWVFWESVIKNLSKLDRTPSDPLTESFFTYSILNSKFEYQIWWILESDSISLSNHNNSFAWDYLAKAYIIWNYNWFAAKSITWSICNILTVPSIIANDLSSTDYSDIVNNKKLVFDWFNNIPNSFSKTKFKTDWWFDFSTNNLIVFSWSCSNLENNILYRINLLSDLKNAYSWTILQKAKNYTNLNNLNIDINSPNIPTKTLADSLTSIILWKKVKTNFSINDMLWTCSLNWVNVNNWDTILTFSESNINNSQTYNCSDISQNRTCYLWVLSWDDNFKYTSCVKWTIDNCSANPSFLYNSHYYNISAMNHGISLTDIFSQNVNENNWIYKYKLNNITCNDWEHISINEDISPILVSCDSWFIVSWNSCVEQWDVILTWADNLSCPWCAN